MREHHLRIIWDIAFVMVFVLGCCDARILAEEDSAWTFLQNEQIKIGVKRTSGGAIGWFSETQTKRNLVNHFDHGRLIQQSYYGKLDGSKWVEQPWRWNPVQGGDYLGSPAKVLLFEQSQEPQRPGTLPETFTETLFVQTRPKHWARGDDIEDVLMEQRISLHGPVARVRFRMTYSGSEIHPKHDQEIPAVFTNRDLETLVIGQKEGIKRYQPGFPNERYACPAHWAAYLDKDDFGLGVFVPQANELTCYRVGEVGQPGACSYFAPLAVFAIRPEMVFEYDCYLTIGTLTEIHQRFSDLNSDEPNKTPGN